MIFPASDFTTHILSTYRSVRQVLNSTLQCCRFSGSHHNFSSSIVDEQGREFPINLIVILCNTIASTTDTTCKEVRENPVSKVKVITQRMCMYLA
jgi:hypothetical protein